MSLTLCSPLVAHISPVEIFGSVGGSVFICFLITATFSTSFKLALHPYFLMDTVCTFNSHRFWGELLKPSFYLLRVDICENLNLVSEPLRAKTLFSSERLVTFFLAAGAGKISLQP